MHTSLTVCNDAASGTLGTYANPEQTLTQTEVTETYSHYTTDRRSVSHGATSARPSMYIIPRPVAADLRWVRSKGRHRIARQSATKRRRAMGLCTIDMRTSATSKNLRCQ